MDKAREPVILSAVRTPIGRFQGLIGKLSATELGAVAVREAVARAGITDPAMIDVVLMGNVVSAGLGQAPARQAAIFAGLPATVGATTVNKVCGSGLKAGMWAGRRLDQRSGSLRMASKLECSSTRSSVTASSMAAQAMNPAMARTTGRRSAFISS